MFQQMQQPPSPWLQIQPQQPMMPQGIMVAQVSPQQQAMAQSVRDAMKIPAPTAMPATTKAPPEPYAGFAPTITNGLKKYRGY